MAEINATSATEISQCAEQRPGTEDYERLAAAFHQAERLDLARECLSLARSTGRWREER